MAIYPPEIGKKNEINTVFRPNQAFPHPNRPVRFKIAKSDFQYFFQIINEIQWIVSARTYNTWLTFDILVNHSFSIFNTISFFNPYALLYSHVVKVQRSKLFITSTSWMFRPMSACKQSQPWSEVNEHTKDFDRISVDTEWCCWRSLLCRLYSLYLNKSKSLMMNCDQTECCYNEFISLGLFSFVWEKLIIQGQQRMINWTSMKRSQKVFRTSKAGWPPN